MNPPEKNEKGEWKAKAFRLRRNHNYSLSFRAKIGREAAELFKEKPGSYLADLVKKHFDFKQLEWKTEMSGEKNEYRAMRREIENAKETIRTARHDWEAGKLLCHVDAPKSRKRLVGSGPPPAFAPIEEALAQYYVHVTKDLDSACPRSILRVKAGQLVTAAKQQGMEEVAHAFEDDGSIRMDW